ncbi:MAG: RNA pseudouridine synthase [Bacteroidota bacterium]
MDTNNQEIPLHEQKPGDWVLVKTHQFIAFNKPAGLPVQGDKTGDKSLLQLGEIYSKSRLYLVHRIDRPATGIVIFAKTNSAAQALSEQFQQRTAQKSYLAVVKNLPPETEGVLRHVLQKNERTNRSKVVSGENEEEGKMAELKYKVLGSSENYHLLEIELLSGRHHQIRAQLAAAGCPVKGDVKYGFRRGNKDRSIHLHAWKLTFKHPVSGEEIRLEAPLPKDPVWDAFQIFAKS